MKAIGLTYPLEIRDAEVSGRVLSALRRDGRVKSDDLRVMVEDGVVTLHGTVDSPFEGHRAARLALLVPGVKRVDSELTVAIEQYLSDQELLERVRAALANHPLLARHGLGAQIRRGVVTLQGRVDSLLEDQAALDAAEEVKGVREVVSALKVGQIDPTDQPVPIVDDATLLSEVTGAIADAGVVIYENQSFVRDGIAHLRGLVRDPRSRERARELAQSVPGLQGVRDELILQANPASHDPDEALTGRVIEAFRQDGRVNPSQVVPEATAGVVILAGQVDSIEDHDAALEVARQVPGVREVVDDIRILGRNPLRATDRESTEPRRTKYRHGGHR